MLFIVCLNKVKMARWKGPCAAQETGQVWSFYSTALAGLQQETQAQAERWHIDRFRSIRKLEARATALNMG